MQYQTNYPYATTSQLYGANSHSREEQRRRQQEYSQALAQQVAQRDQQKRRERELEHQYGGNNAKFQNQPPFEQSRYEGFEPEGGIFDGLGRNNYQSSRTSFARGQPQLHHRLPGGPEAILYPNASEFPSTGVSRSGQVFQPPSVNFPPAQNQSPVDNQSFQRDLGNSAGPNHQQPQQSWKQQPGHAQSGLGPNFQTGWPPQQNSQAQPRTSQFWTGQTVAEQAAPPSFGGYGSPQREPQQSGFPQVELTHNGGRRQRTDIHDGGRGDSEEAERLRRKLQQQQEMQLALERQIEEKRQQKQEAKRRQEEEDRREMERFEEDKRRQRADEERLQEEKRRKTEIEQQKAEQAAAAVAAANQQAKLQQQQKLHPQISQQHPQLVQPFQHQHFSAQPQLQQPVQFPNVSSPNKLKNPFTNSRARLFEDPPPQQSPHREPMVPNNHFEYSNQNASPMRAGPQGFGQVFQHENNDLRRQYDDMREELTRQKQLVDQLRQAQAQIQHQQQQHSPIRTESGSIPTLLDLEKLRNELRGELAYREQIHRQELESLKREQQHERSPVHSPHRHPGVKNSFSLSIRGVPNNVEQVPPQPAPTTAAFERRQSHHSPIKAGRNSQSIGRLPRLPEAPLDESLMSLHGESKFVYFDGWVAEAGKPRNAVVSQATNESKDEGVSIALGKQRKSVKVESPKARRSLRRSSTKLNDVNQPGVTISSPAPAKKMNNFKDAGTDSVDQSHDFVVTSIARSPLHKQHQHLISSPTSHPSTAAASSHRYSQIPSVQSGEWRLESMGTNDSDDDLDASLDGEQLEALFQRNVRRHEILLGFQTKVQVQDSNQQEGGGAPHTKLAWAELHQQLESNRRVSTRDQQRKLSTASTDFNDSNREQYNHLEDEVALVASSQWMQSSLLEHTSSRNK